MSIPSFSASTFPPPPSLAPGKPLNLPAFSRQIAPLDLPPPPPLPSVFLAPANFSLPMLPSPLPDRELAPAPPNLDAFIHDTSNFTPPTLHNPKVDLSPMPLSPTSPQVPPSFKPNVPQSIPQNVPQTPPPASAPSMPDPWVTPPATSPTTSTTPPMSNPLPSPPVATDPPASPPMPPSTPPDTEPSTPPAIPPPVDLPPDVRGFDDGIMRSLNLRLEDPDWMRRADAANDYFIILSGNPNLEKRPQFKPYVDAFALKILRDPSSVVHEAMLRAMQVGYYRYPSPEVLNELNRLRDSVGMLGLEAQMVDDAIAGIQKAQLQDAQDAQAQQQQARAPMPPQDPITPRPNGVSK